MPRFLVDVELVERATVEVEAVDEEDARRKAEDRNEWLRYDDVNASHVRPISWAEAFTEATNAA